MNALSGSLHYQPGKTVLIRDSVHRPGYGIESNLMKSIIIWILGCL